MYDRGREEELWRQSGARYRVKEEKKRDRQADNFDSDVAEKGRKRLPTRLAALENAYGNVEFTRHRDKSLRVSFARRQEFKEPVFERDEEKIHLGHQVKAREGSTVRFRNSGSPSGAESFILAPEKSASRQLKRILGTARSPLDQMARSMAAALIPVSGEVMGEGQRELIAQDLERTARRVLTREKRDREKEDPMKKDMPLMYRRAEKAGESRGGGEEPSEGEDLKEAEDSESGPER